MSEVEINKAASSFSKGNWSKDMEMGRYDGFIYAATEWLQSIQSAKGEDTARLDKLQGSTEGYGDGWMLRRSTTGRGMRLHETADPNAIRDVRQAIDAYLPPTPDEKGGEG